MKTSCLPAFLKIKNKVCSNTKQEIFEYLNKAWLNKQQTEIECLLPFRLGNLSFWTSEKVISGDFSSPSVLTE
jgi:hypothetical protein